MPLDFRLTASIGAVRLTIEGLDGEVEDAIWDSWNEGGGAAQCSAVHRATGYRRGMRAVSASTRPLDLEFLMDANAQEAADAVHLRILDLGIDLTVPLPIAALP